MSRPFELVYTTADMGFTARADNLPELFARAAQALFTIISDPAKITPESSIHIQLHAGNWADLLVNWLNEIIYIREVRNMLFARARVIKLEPYCLRAEIWGQAYDPACHVIGNEVKAVTYHQLSLEQDEKGCWRLRVIVDI